MAVLNKYQALKVLREIANEYSIYTENLGVYSIIKPEDFVLIEDDICLKDTVKLSTNKINNQ